MTGRRKDFAFQIGEIIGSFEVKECIYGIPSNKKKKDYYYRVICINCMQECLKNQSDLKKYIDKNRRCRCHRRGQQSSFKYEIGDRFGNMIIVRRYWEQCKIYDLECEICKNINIAKEANMNKKRKCTFCQHTTSKVAENINSIVASEDTLWMVDYFLGGYNEAKLYRLNSNKKIKLKCPDCQTIIPTRINQLKNRGGIACPCAKNNSLPERVLSSLLKMNDINFIPQFSSKDQSWCGNYRYDFYLPKYNTIIETHGSQHYEGHRHPKWKSFDEEQLNDKRKEVLAKNNDIKQYIVIDCRKTDIDSIVKNVIDNGFLKHILPNTNKGEMMTYFKRTFMGEVCQYYETNKPILIKDIAEKFNIYPNTVRYYLRMGDEVGMCSYNKEEIIKYGKTKSGQKPKKVRVYTKEKEIGIFPSAKETVSIMKQLYGIELHRSKISNCCNGKRKSHKGYFFEFC